MLADAKHFAKVLPGKLGAAIHRGDDGQARFVEHEPRDAAAHGAKAPLKDTNWLLHTHLLVDKTPTPLPPSPAG